MWIPGFFQGADTQVKVALIAAFVALATSLLTVAHSLFGAPLKYWLEKKALRNKLATEYEYEQRKNLRTLIGRYHGRMLEAAETLNHRIWNLYQNEAKGWLSVKGQYDNPGYYFRTFVYRFLNLLALTRQFESEAVFIDSRIAERQDLDFLKYVKAINWAVCDVALFRQLDYDGYHATDHFFRDDLRHLCDSCLDDDGGFLGQMDLRSALEQAPGANTLYQFFDDLKKTETRFRWDRVVALHLLLMAFINSFGYDMQRSTPEQFADVASRINNLQVLRNLGEWLPKLGLADQSEAARVRAAIGAQLASTTALQSARSTA
jgi:hypothetical protein